MWNSHLYCCRWARLGLNVTGTGSPDAKKVLFWEVVDRATALLLEAFRLWNFVLLLWFFCQHLCEKHQMWVSEPRFWEVVGYAWPWLMASCKAMVDFLFELIELFSLPVMVPGLWGEMCTDRLFLQGVNLFVLKFYLDRVIPHRPFLASEN